MGKWGPPKMGTPGPHFTGRMGTRVPIFPVKWGPGSPSSQENGDPGSPFYQEDGDPIGKRLREVNFNRYGACTKQLAGKRVSFCSSFKVLSTDTTFIKIGVCYQKLLTLEMNFHIGGSPFHADTGSLATANKVGKGCGI